MNDVSSLLTTKTNEFIQKQFSAKAKSLISHDLTEAEKKDLIHYFIYTRAMNRATIIHERTVPNSYMVAHKDEASHYFESKIEELSKITSQDEFNEWHKSICNNNNFGMRYGLWQKLINITLKYIYCVQKHFPEYATALNYAHCPIDRNITKKIAKNSKNLEDPEFLELIQNISGDKNGANWNNINENQYYMIQNRVHNICCENNFVVGNRSISNLEYDVANWK